MILKLPLSVTLPRKTKADKVFMLNMNVYRNAHHMILNQSKIMWEGIVRAAIVEKNGYFNILSFCEPPFKFVYTVHKGDNRAYDVANICSIIDKFTCDALIELGIIKDDNHKILHQVEYRTGSKDKENPHCELEITHMEV
jgi:hypothetical protein